METRFQVGRAILAFDKATGRLVERIAIALTLEQLKPLFPPAPDDPLLYLVYDISAEQAARLHELDNTIVLATNQYDYQLDCHQLRAAR